MNMSFPWNILLAPGIQLVEWLLNIIGNAMVTILIRPLVNYVIIPLLQSTIFGTIDLSGQSSGIGGLIGRDAAAFWTLSAVLSLALALFSGVWGVLSTSLSTFSSQQRDYRTLLEGLLLYFLVLIGGYQFIALLTGITNQVVLSLVNESKAIVAFSNMAGQFDLTAAAATAAVVLLGDVITPIIVLALVGALLWVVVSWIMRMVDIIFYTGLLPITAALTLTGNKTAFQWNLSEAVAAVITQAAMAITWYLAAALLTGNFDPHHMQDWHIGIGTQLVQLLIGIFAFTLVARAPAMVQEVIGHRHAGVAGMALGVAAGGVAFSAARRLAGASRLGVATGRGLDRAEARSEEIVNNWGNRRTAGEAFAQSRVGQAMSGAVTKYGEKLSRSASTFVKKYPGAAKAGSVLAGAAAATAGSAPGRGVSRMIRGVRTAASYAYQPLTSMGRNVQASYGLAGDSRYNTETATLRSKVKGMSLGRAAYQERMAPEDLLQRIANPGAPPHLRGYRNEETDEAHLPPFTPPPGGPPDDPPPPPPPPPPPFGGGGRGGNGAVAAFAATHGRSATSATAKGSAAPSVAAQGPEAALSASSVLRARKHSLQRTYRAFEGASGPSHQLRQPEGPQRVPFAERAQAAGDRAAYMADVLRSPEPPLSPLERLERAASYPETLSRHRKASLTAPQTKGVGYATAQEQAQETQEAGYAAAQEQGQQRVRAGLAAQPVLNTEFLDRLAQEREQNEEHGEEYGMSW